MMVQYSLDDGHDFIEFKKSWERAIKRISAEVPAQWRERFVGPLRLQSLHADKAVILAPGKFTAEWVRDRLLKRLEEVLSEEAGRGIRIELVVAPRERSAPAQAVVAMPAVQDTTRFKPNKKYRFDSFVVGQSNRLAHAGAKAVAANPGTTGNNPLFIYGTSGLGKTHLLHAIAHEILTLDPNYSIVYVSAQQFSEDFVHALQTGRIDQFRRSQRNVGVWLVDDIQFVVGRDRTQEEVFHTFNYLHSLGKQIVLTSDRPPRDLYSMDERLRSRFEAGLVADIQMPDTETRCAIVLSKAAQENIAIDHQVAMVLAEHVPGNIRVLEGALTRVAAEASLANVPIDEGLALALVEQHFRDGVQPKPGLAQILDVVSAHFRIPIEEIRGAKRHAPIVHARHVAVYLTRELTGESWKRIGSMFGDRDHTSMMHGYQKINDMVIRDREVRGEVKQLLRRLKPQNS